MPLDDQLLALVQEFRRESRDEHASTRAELSRVGERVASLETDLRLFREAHSSLRRDWPARAVAVTSFLGLLIQALFHPWWKQ